MSDPGEKCGPTNRMTTKAEAQASTVVLTASSSLQSGGPSWAMVEWLTPALSVPGLTVPRA
ncbi:hypothetical protein GCM10009616_18740 [Microlunatus lacustris]